MLDTVVSSASKDRKKQSQAQVCDNFIIVFSVIAINSSVSRHSLMENMNNKNNTTAL